EVSTTAPVTVVGADLGSEEIYVSRPEVPEQETQRIGQVFAFVTTRQYWQGAFIWPHNGRVTSPFGMGRTYNNGWSSYHSGIDLSGDLGAPVVAAATGRVALAAPLLVQGNAVILDHGWGVFSGYYHLSEILVTEGQEVVQGELIGRIGNTGLSTGAHLHWEIRVGGVPVEPGEWTSRQIPE
ncbi:MAG: M23 family metallopeptidase, partial [Chloroflexota bacterium]|nr:M23 family metallopeptidase [Chloroflexota bacterium]